MCGSAYYFVLHRQVKLLCANKTVEDIMWAEELDALLSSSNGG